LGIFNGGFVLPSPRNAQKRDKKFKQIGLGIFDFCKNKSTRFYAKSFL
jgi:hypothetical protein